MKFTSAKAPADNTSMVQIVDDDPMVRESIDNLLRSIGMRTRLYASAAELLADAPMAVPRCVVTDIRMPGMSGLELQNGLRARGNMVPVIFITGHGDIPTTVRAMKSGAVDFLTKPFRDQEIIDAVTTALARDQARLVRDRESAAVRSRYDTLTSREREVMALVTAGNLNKRAAEALGLSEITVKLHRASVMRKMAARTLVELVQLAETLAVAG